MKQHFNYLRRGLSLVEVTFSSLLVGTLVVSALQMTGASVRTAVYSADLAKGPLLAEAMLAEIMSVSYHNPEDDSTANSTNDGESTTTRQDFDDVGDYDNYSPSQVEDRFGNALPEYTGWSISVNVWWAVRNSGSVNWLWNTGLKGIAVVVTAPDGTQTERVGFRSKDGSLEQQPLVDRVVVSRVTTNLSIGLGSNVSGKINLLNHVEDPND